MAIDDAFNRTTDYYDAWIRKAVPGYDDMFAIAAELLPFDAAAPVSVLDLGAGTGLFARLIQRLYPQADFVLWDVAEKMLEVARERFRENGDRFRYVVGDYRTLDETEGYDLAISSLSIHHLADEEKRDLFRRVFGALRSGGIFLNIDQIRGTTPALQELYCRKWEEKTRAAGATEEEVQGGLERRRLYDREATMEDQLRWLREAGFSDVDCIYRNWLMGLFFAAKP